MECSRFKLWRKKALEGLICDQWNRIEKLEDEVVAYHAEYVKAIKLHCESTMYMMGTAHVKGERTFKASEAAYDNYVRKVHDLGYAQMSFIYKTEALGRAEDRYNELVIELENLFARGEQPVDVEDIMEDECQCDELEAMDPPPLRAARRTRSPRKKSRGLQKK